MNTGNDHLARDIARSDPQDPQAQTSLLGRIRQLRGSIPPTAHNDLAANLDMAGLLTQYLVRMGGIGPEDVLQIISRLVSEVELAFAINQQSVTLNATNSVHLEAPQGSTELRLVGQDRSTRAKFLGEVLVQMGFTTQAQVQEALEVQKATGVRIGEVLVSMGAVNWKQVRRAVEVQEQLRRAVEGG
jgi:hypothetical protein